jgi:hypothetical protein
MVFFVFVKMTAKGLKRTSRIDFIVWLTSTAEEHNTSKSSKILNDIKFSIRVHFVCHANCKVNYNK